MSDALSKRNVFDMAERVTILFVLAMFSCLDPLVKTLGFGLLASLSSVFQPAKISVMNFWIAIWFSLGCCFVGVILTPFIYISQVHLWIAPPAIFAFIYLVGLLCTRFPMCEMIAKLVVLTVLFWLPKFLTAEPYPGYRSALVVQTLYMGAIGGATWVIVSVLHIVFDPALRYTQAAEVAKFSVALSNIISKLNGTKPTQKVIAELEILASQVKSYRTRALNPFSTRPTLRAYKALIPIRRQCAHVEALANAVYNVTVELQDSSTCAGTGAKVPESHFDQAEPILENVIDTLSAISARASDLQAYVVKGTDLPDNRNEPPHEQMTMLNTVISDLEHDIATLRVTRSENLQTHELESYLTTHARHLVQMRQLALVCVDYQVQSAKVSDLSAVQSLILLGSTYFATSPILADFRSATTPMSLGSFQNSMLNLKSTITSIQSWYHFKLAFAIGCAFIPFAIPSINEWMLVEHFRYLGFTTYIVSNVVMYNLFFKSVMRMIGLTLGICLGTLLALPYIPLWVSQGVMFPLVLFLALLMVCTERWYPRYAYAATLFYLFFCITYWPDRSNENVKDSINNLLSRVLFNCAGICLSVLVHVLGWPIIPEEQTVLGVSKVVAISGATFNTAVSCISRNQLVSLNNDQTDLDTESHLFNNAGKSIGDLLQLNQYATSKDAISVLRTQAQYLNKASAYVESMNTKSVISTGLLPSVLSYRTSVINGLLTDMQHLVHNTQTITRVVESLLQDLPSALLENDLANISVNESRTRMMKSILSVAKLDTLLLDGVVADSVVPRWVRYLGLRRSQSAFRRRFNRTEAVVAQSYLNKEKDTITEAHSQTRMKMTIHNRVADLLSDKIEEEKRAMMREIARHDQYTAMYREYTRVLVRFSERIMDIVHQQAEDIELEDSLVEKSDV